MILDEMSAKYEGLLRDESRMQGHAEAVARPSDTHALIQAVREAAARGMQLTTQGAATGLAGGAVPQGGLLLSMRGMNKILGLREENGNYYLQAQAGVTFSQAEDYLRRPLGGKAWFLAQSPSEKSATLGGAFACNAMGINRLRYGRFLDCVSGLTWVTPQGELLRPGRGDETLAQLAGSEGRLGVAAVLELALQPVPGANWGVFFFFGQLGRAKLFANALASGHLTACEYFDQASLELLQANLPENAREAIYIELSGEDEAALEDDLAQLLDVFNGRDEDTWAADSLPEIEKFRAICHSVVELVNNEIDKAQVPGAVKYDLDFQSGRVWEQLDACREQAARAGIPLYCFGHVLPGQAHVCPVPRSVEEKAACEALMERWAARVVEQGGLLAVENGFGKNKRQLMDLTQNHLRSK